MDKSRRYCLKCRKITTWKRPKKELHSKCSVCGGRIAAKRRDKKVKPVHRGKYKKRGGKASVQKYLNNEEY